MPGIIEIQGNLFTCPPTSSMAHCVSEDMRLGKGIAVHFKKKFEGIDELKTQGKKAGDVAVLSRGKRFIYNLVTKSKYSDKPTYISLESSLHMMKDHCLKNNVSHVAMPRIGCGLDGLEWRKVKDILRAVFSDTDIFITVYSL